MSLSDLHLRAARAAIARAALDALPDAALGDVILRADQRLTVSRAGRALDRVGGCLIGEDVGRGKTFVALAIARRWDAPLVIGPAALRSTWRMAAQRAGVEHVFESHESLSRGHVPIRPFDGIIVDESHHFRTPATRRYAGLAALAARAPIILLSATPLQNRARDLAAQIALFFGERAFALGMTELSRFIIRSDSAVLNMPMVAPPQWLPLDVDDTKILAAILDLAPAARPLDGGDAGVLRTINLVRAWASSRAALQATLHARRRVATAIEQALEAGRTPTRREARAWTGADDVIQLGFASLLVSSSGHMTDAVVRDDLGSIQRLLALLKTLPDPDVARAAALRALRREHPASRILAFSEFASTVGALFCALRNDAGVGMLTANEARIASGRISRDDLLGNFSPVAQGRHSPPLCENVSLLLATDLLSEGVNLQDADVVVHLDLPWNPAKMAQRVGRVRRPGGSAEVQSYLMSPPTNAAILLDVEARLRKKLETTVRAVGENFAVLPHMAAASSIDDSSAATAQGAYIEQISTWHRGTGSTGRSCIVAGVRSTERLWLAAFSDGCLHASLNKTPQTILSGLAQAVQIANGLPRSLEPCELRNAMREVDEWLSASFLASVAGLDGADGPQRQLVLRWLGTAIAKVPRHQLPVVLRLTSTIRGGMRVPFGIGAERQLAALASVGFSELHATLETMASVIAAATTHRSGGDRQVKNAPPTIVALVIAGP